ncbi:uncharacterized protein LOC100366457 [Saccoglossus kowalevskii]|uniref:F-box/LRR-repeat protein 13-like n=1 Tax=Saccoglossus kowalevskii TaxID=10224 RepID=A0ABM0MAC3_SACKO|nr:PREDICTED: F-box/LRR-repeat protein 13-like [Saccoglossus kowalevskii]
MADHLPVEVISHMMKFLSLPDRKEAALVSRSWYEAAMDPALQRDVIITFQTPSMAEEPIAGFGRRKSPNLLLNNIDGSSNSKFTIQKACQYMGHNLQMLSLKGSDITEGAFMSIVPYCHNLTSLDLSSCNSLFMSGKFLGESQDLESVKAALVHVTDLNLSAIRYLSDSLFNRVMSCVPNVQKLSLASCHLTFEFDPYKGKQGDSGTGCNSKTILTFSNVLSLLHLRSNKLKSLDFSRTSITNKGIRSLVDIPGLELRELILKSCREMTDDGVLMVSKKQPSLENLDISLCQDLRDGAVSAIRLHLQNLQKLNIYKCRYVTDRSVHKLCSSFPSLTHFNVSDCYQLTSKGLVSALCSTGTSSLVSLNLNCCSLVQDDLIIEMAKVMKHLKELDLGSCVHITDVSVNVIAKSFGLLRVLRLAWCKEVTDFGILGLEKFIYHDTTVNEVQAEQIGGQTITMITPGKPNQYSSGRFSRNYGNIGMFSSPAQGDTKPPQKVSYSEMEMEITRNENIGIYTLTSLQSLDLCSNHRITDLGVMQGIRFRELRKLNLSMCTQVTDESLKCISVNNSSLEELFLSQCQKITDVGIATIAKNLFRLALLDMSSCDLVTNESLKTLGFHCNQLKHLDVSMCDKITLEGVYRLTQKLTSLVVQARYVGGGGNDFNLYAH